MSSVDAEVYWSTLEHSMFHNRPLYLAATEKGLCLITLPHESFETLRVWTEKKSQGAALVEDTERMSGYIRQLREYFDGQRTTFALPLDFRGTAFQVSVWEALFRIPYGQTRSYSELAEAAGSPKAVRAAGAANGANPIPFVVPCHRVIGKNATLTGYRGGLQVKEELLRLEGIGEFIARGHERFLF